MKRLIILAFTTVLAVALFAVYFHRSDMASEEVRQSVQDTHLPADPEPVTLEAWVRLDSYTVEGTEAGCPVLIEHEGYRLGLACWGIEGPAGTPVVVSPEEEVGAKASAAHGEVVPLGEWVHLAAVVHRRGELEPEHLTDPYTNVELYMGGQKLHVASASPTYFEDQRTECERRRESLQDLSGWKEKLDCEATAGAPDGRVGDARLVRRVRTGEQIAGAMGSGGQLGTIDDAAEVALLEARAAEREDRVPEPAEELTGRGLAITLGLLLACALMVAAGLHFMRRSGRRGIGHEQAL
jgi:hypothetical protein